ncbi:MAG: hypothetical protein R3C05_07075 [Pirellulaceae bacterium]
MLIEAPQLIESLREAAASGEQRVDSQHPYAQSASRVVAFEEVGALAEKVEHLSRQNKTEEAIALIVELEEKTREMTEIIQNWLVENRSAN